MRYLAPSPTLISLLPVLTAAAPSAPTLTGDEITLLHAHKIVVRSDLADPTGGSAVGIVDIQATPEHTFAAVVEGGTRLVYRSTSDTGRAIPAWIKRWVASEGLSQQLSGIRARAEHTP